MLSLPPLYPAPAAAALRPQRTRLPSVLSIAGVAVGFGTPARPSPSTPEAEALAQPLPPHQSLTGQLACCSPRRGDGTELETGDNSIPGGGRETLAWEAPALPRCAGPSLPPSPQRLSFHIPASRAGDGGGCARTTRCPVTGAAPPPPQQSAAPLLGLQQRRRRGADSSPVKGAPSHARSCQSLTAYKLIAFIYLLIFRNGCLGARVFF